MRICVDSIGGQSAFWHYSGIFPAQATIHSFNPTQFFVLQSTHPTTKFTSTTIFVALAAATSVSAFAPGVTNLRPAVSSNAAAVSRQPKAEILATGRRDVLLQQAIASEDQVLHTAERLAGMSRMEVQHIFEDVDGDGNGVIDFAELDLLKSYFGDNAWDDDTKKKLMEEMDTDGDGTIDSEEFYKWMVLNASNVGTADEKGTKALQRREERLKLADATIDDHMMELLDELNVSNVEQKVTHPLHSDFGRTLYDHFVSCYVLAKEWGNSKTVCDAALFHAVYQRGDGMRAVDFEEYRPKLQEKLGKDVEELIYLFPSSHKSCLLEDGLLMAPVGGDLEVPNVLEGGTVTIPERLRPALVELEVINSHDQHVLENSDAVANLWKFYQHATVLFIMSDGAKGAVMEYLKRSLGASTADILAWHEGRFASAGGEIPALWQKHLELFRKGGKFCCVEQEIRQRADTDGDGEIDFQEMVNFDWETCFIDA